MENALSAVKKKIDKDIIAKHVWKSAMNIQEKVGHFGGHTISGMWQRTAFRNRKNVHCLQTETI